MPITKIYKCCICHSVLEEYKPIRLVKQRWDTTRNVYRNRANYDFCIDCYKKFNNWIKKHKEVKE